MDELVRDMRSCETAEGVDRVYAPGEIEHLRRLEHLRTGIPLAESVISELGSFGRAFGMGPLAEGASANAREET